MENKMSKPNINWVKHWDRLNIIVEPFKRLGYTVNVQFLDDDDDEEVEIYLEIRWKCEFVYTRIYNIDNYILPSSESIMESIIEYFVNHATIQM